MPDAAQHGANPGQLIWEPDSASEMQKIRGFCQIVLA